MRKRLVSIHAPYAGSDAGGKERRPYGAGFNPRPLCRERRCELRKVYHRYHVSIHAPYAGSDDTFPTPLCYTIQGFNPRPLCRERLSGITQLLPSLGVSIHAPYAGSDVLSKDDARQFKVSIHAPYAGSDSNFSQKFFLIFSRNRQIIISNT